VAYRLEPEGYATRFPLVVGQLLAGRLPAHSVPAARRELETVAAELAQLPIEAAVISPHDLGRPQIAPELAADARHLAELFRASDGRLLLDVLRERLSSAEAEGSAVVIDVQGLDVRQARRDGSLLIAIGLAWAGLGLALAPHAVLARGGARHGPLLWPLGLGFAAWGALGLLGAARPELGTRLRSAWGVGLAVVLFGALVALTWR
jgi:hypothetical protein